jgi:hypothetical protein
MTASDTVTLLDPSAEDVPDEHPLAARLTSLKGATIGLVDNTKHNSDLFLQDIETLLRDQYGVSHVVYRRKANANTPAPPDLIAEVATPCDAVIHAVAD